MGKKLLYLAWILAFLVVVKTSSFIEKEETTEFQGIAETREVIINSENSVEIRTIHVLPGQEVQKGRVLVELERPELTMKLNEITHQLEALKSQNVCNRDEIKSQIRQLMANKKVTLSEIDHKIDQMTSRYSFNKEMVSGLKSISDTSKAPKNVKKPGALEIEIENLKQERYLTEKRFQTEIDDLKRRLASSETPETIRQESLKKELELLEKEKESLLILASIDGIIGSIYCKAGEKVSPFQPILTLHTCSPSYVRGYIHENIHNLASTGDRVQVAALTGDGKQVEGEIVGVGSRIIEYPLRLKKRPEMQLWGREVEIHLPDNNPFLLGEKVIIQTNNHNKAGYLAWLKRWFALESYAAEAAMVDKESDIPITGADMEASGLIYLKDLDRYLVISDEVNKKKSILYLMDHKGRITNELKIEGVDKIDDMEAICQDDSGTIYLSCSQDRKHNGKLPDERKRFVQIRRSGSRLVSDGQVLLHDLLKEAALKSPDEKWAKFMGKKSKNIEIEGMFVEENDLFLGFKKPLKGKQAVILKISNFPMMLEKNRLDADQIQIWRTLDLQDHGKKIANGSASDNDSQKALVNEFENDLIHGEAMKPGADNDANAVSSTGISDLCRHQDKLLVLSSNHEKKHGKSAEAKTVGVLRVFDFNDGTLITTHYFNQLTPEGIAYDSLRDCFVVTFDQGADAPSRVTVLKPGAWG